MFIPITYSDFSFIKIRFGHDNKEDPFLSRLSIYLIDTYMANTDALVFGYIEDLTNSYIDIYYKTVSKISQTSSILLLGQVSERLTANVQLIGEATNLIDSDLDKTNTLYCVNSPKIHYPTNNIWNSSTYAVFENLKSENSGIYHLIATTCTSGVWEDVVDMYFVIRYHHSTPGVINIVERPVSGRDKIVSISAELMPGETYRNGCYVKLTIDFGIAQFYYATIQEIFSNP